MATRYASCFDVLIEFLWFYRFDLDNKLFDSWYDKKFKDTHLNWPTDEAIGGSSFEFNLMKEEHRISELDRHPNAKGHELIANYLFEKLEGVLWRDGIEII